MITEQIDREQRQGLPKVLAARFISHFSFAYIECANYYGGTKRQAVLKLCRIFDDAALDPSAINNIYYRFRNDIKEELPKLNLYPLNMDLGYYPTFLFVLGMSLGWQTYIGNTDLFFKSILKLDGEEQEKLKKRLYGDFKNIAVIIGAKEWAQTPSL